MSPRRPYSSPRRAAQAEATRQALLEAAERLFAERGYRATPVRQIAEEVGVVPQTVYDVFGGKRGLLKALADRHTAMPPVQGEGSCRRERARETVRGAMAASNRLDLRAIVAEAAASDPELADLLAWADQRSHDDVVRITRYVVGDGPTEGQLTAVADRLWATLSTQTFRRLRHRGWSAERAEEWAMQVVQAAFDACSLDLDG